MGENWLSKQQTLESEVLGVSGGPSKRRLAIATVVVAACGALTLLAGGVTPAQAADPAVESALIQAAKAAPGDSFKVIVQGEKSERSDKLVRRLATDLAKNIGVRGSDGKEVFAGLRDQFDSINAVSVTLTGREIVKLARTSGLAAITLDAPIAVQWYGNWQKWPDAVNARWYWGSTALSNAAASMPAIAIVDSGVAPENGDLGTRVIAQVDLATSQPNSPGDGYGHGTMVAGLAAGANVQHAGVNPRAKIVSIDVIDDIGRANTSDVIRACDWILANKAQYNIRVANLSLGAAGQSSFRWDPLDRAVEQLWFSGVTVVTSAGNYGVATGPSGVPLSPANDPFVITVGATEVRGLASATDDAIPSWSAYGYTNDGFAKPDVGAPGRYMISAIPGVGSTLGRAGGQDPRLVAWGYLKLSGTSFAAPVVAGAAAALLGAHPDWTPDQVKGALMQTAVSPALNNARQVGVGSIDLRAALGLASPPNPNAALLPFVTADPAGGAVPVFDEASWASAAQANASWASASWASASWASASWASASWASASWASASWASASWSSASWASASWANASWANAAAGDDAIAEEVYAPIVEVVPEAPIG